jgi:hypothetical protein
LRVAFALKEKYCVNSSRVLLIEEAGRAALLTPKDAGAEDLIFNAVQWLKLAVEVTGAIIIGLGLVAAVYQFAERADAAATRKAITRYADAGTLSRARARISTRRGYSLDGDCAHLGSNRQTRCHRRDSHSRLIFSDAKREEREGLTKGVPEADAPPPVLPVH